MNYEKKYKEAFEIAKEVYHDHRKDRYWRDWLTKLFPELRDGENGQMIERLKSCVYDAYLTKECRNELIAWLEKQAEKKNTHKREIDDAYLKGICDAKHEIEKQGEKLDADKVIGWIVANICDYEYYVKRFKKDFEL